MSSNIYQKNLDFEIIALLIKLQLLKTIHDLSYAVLYSL